jgi:two-component system, OmpR family, phosphate regulon response regulator PhoB
VTDSKKRILLVEDDRFLRRACEAGLKQRGFIVTCATDGEEGLRLAQSEVFDLILLDLLMPKKPGIEVLEELRADGPPRADIPVIILANSSREEDKRRAVALGAVGYYVKANLSLKALGDEIERLLS